MSDAFTTKWERHLFAHSRRLVFGVALSPVQVKELQAAVGTARNAKTKAERLQVFKALLGLVAFPENKIMLFSDLIGKAFLLLLFK